MRKLRQIWKVGPMNYFFNWLGTLHEPLTRDTPPTRSAREDE